ncbi:MAG: pyruvate, phosphate dikinase [Candidatus Stahlbacteria bacterium]|nr:pyruvate, phosphate dikinase [Candidatus Stahlbacteria bacterium]
MKWVYFFGNNSAEGSAELKNLLGGKGANLHEMTNLGLPVPPGFTITTEVCKYYYSHNETYPADLKQQIAEALAKIECVMGRKFGNPDSPLLLSVRSGARVSMPGMMDTVLNIGLNADTVLGLIKHGQNPGFAYDCERRLIQMYGGVVLGISDNQFESLLANKKAERGVSQDTELTPEDWLSLIEQYKKVVSDFTYKDFPSDPDEQLMGAISAVFNSWNSKRAIEYRRFYDIPDDWGTAVNVQAMVYGNMGGKSATGVAFTRNPATGENVFYGEWLPDAQGEDVVAGIRTPYPLNDHQRGDSKLPSLEKEMPANYSHLLDIRQKLEHHFRDLQDIEFTIEQGKLWMLQTRRGQRTSITTVKIAVDMVEEGLITKEEAIQRVATDDIETLLHPMLDPRAHYDVIAIGLPASPGAVSGEVVFTPEEAVALKEQGKKTILVRTETSPEDIAGMVVCEGILTQHGGMTSHAAVVARGMGKPCIVGCEAIIIDYENKEFKVKDLIVKQGDVITIGGGTGRVILGDVPKVRASHSKEFETLLGFADEIRKLGIRANADTPEQARIAREFGAEGIGLCRTEHMFFGDSRIQAMREMILADNEEERRKALAKLLQMQKDDFKGIFREMHNLPVIIRTLDPPLHEFLPHGEQRIGEVAEEMKVDVNKIHERIKSLTELNPLLGWRGCRLGISYPEITEMQAQAIFQAACELKQEGVEVIPEVMIPLVSEAKEFEHQRKIVDRVAKETIARYGVSIKYYIGTMIEIPRAVLTATTIARTAEFFSFGTNDLTQTTFGFSRDDIGKILPDYVKKGILKWDPFQRIDEEGVGTLIRMGIEWGRVTNQNLEVGICGEHGGEPHSIEFCHKAGMNYVSCSPFRVPVARLAAAQAVIKEKETTAYDVR